MIKTKIPNSCVLLSIDEYFLFINLKHVVCKYFRESFNRFPYRELLPESHIRDCFVVSFDGEMDLFRHLGIYFEYNTSITKITLQDMINTIKLNGGVKYSSSKTTEQLAQDIQNETDKLLLAMMRFLASI